MGFHGDSRKKVVTVSGVPSSRFRTQDARVFYDGVWVSHLTFPFPSYRSTATFEGGEHISYLWGSKKQTLENSVTQGGKSVYANRAGFEYQCIWIG